ncbi:MAG: sugar phosphate isomerase/epimerase [Candidatus Promineifilaceae bacterium]|nr:sugar phosphate isomerase/epimerase [Candidatus Promineifilaceae bacterium]
MAIKIGLMLEAVRHQDKPFVWGVEKAAEIGYEYIEPMLHTGRELLSEAGYYHSVSQLDDPLWVREVVEANGLKLSGFSSHAPLCKPEVSLEWLKGSIRFAHYAGAPVINTDEGPKPAWTSKEMDYTLMTYTLTEAAMVAQRHGVKIGLEPHQQYSKTQEGLDSIYELVDSPAIGINFDTGNSYLAGLSDPYGWLDHVKERVIHVHAKDIDLKHSEAERGKVTGTPVGCACGDGVIDWKQIIDILKPVAVDKDIVLSVECGTIPQAVRSFEHLSQLV